MTVRAPAKVNLELRVGPPSRRRVPRARHRLPGGVAARRGHRRALDDWPVVARGPYADRVPTDASNLAVRAARLVAEQVGRRRARSRSASTRRSRWPAGWPAARPTRPPPSGVRPAVGARPRPRRARRARGQLGSDVPFVAHRRHRDGLRPRRAARAGAGPRHLPLGLRHQRHRPVDPGGVCRVRPPARTRRASPCPSRRSARAHGGPALGRPGALGAALHNDLEPAAFSLRPELRELRDAGVEFGALGGIVSGSGPTVAFLTESHEAALDLASPSRPPASRR